MSTPETSRQDRDELRRRTEAVCERFGDEYWRRTDQAREYPHAFVDAMTAAGLLAVMVPTEFGGGGHGLAEAAVVLETINRRGGHSAACHAQLYTMSALLRHGSEEQKAAYLPGIARGDLRLQSFSITEEAGSNTLGITTTATPEAGGYRINGFKTWTSRMEQSDLVFVLARTGETPPGTADGLTLFLVDMRDTRASQPEAIRVDPIRTMFNYATNQVTYDDLWVPESALIGEVGRGFRYVLTGMNAERTLLASEAIGDAYWFIERAVAYAEERVVFGRPIGQNQGVQFPLAEVYMKVRAAELARDEALRTFDAHEPAGAAANMAKYLAGNASWEAANVCLDTHGGYGFVDTYDVERKFRETRLYKVAPVSDNMILSFIATKVLGLPKSY